MNALIKSAKIISPNSPFHLQTKDILIEDGFIKEIGDQINTDAQTIEAEGLIVSDGWMDLFSVIREPGNEHQDTLAHLINSAKSGGFTSILGVSGSTPPIDNKSQVQYIKNQALNQIVNVLPVGTITEQQEGKEITEMFDMYNSGAVAFSDGKQYLKNPELLKRALLYTKPFNAKLICYCEDATVANGGMINEGEVAATLGMKVRPALAEELAVTRDLYIAEYTDSPIHITAVSSAKTIEIIKEAKAKDIRVTCDVNIFHLYFNDEALTDFDTNFKILPPLRTEKDRLALIKGLKDGTIDAISSGHSPKDIETKFCEFDNADFGAISLEALFGAAYKVLSDHFKIEEIINFIATNPRAIFNEKTVIREQSAANLTLFTLSESSLNPSDIKSGSKNCPFTGETLNGKVIGTINNNQINIL